MMDQMDLFDRPNLNVTCRLKAAMRESLKNCDLSREQVAERITEIMKVEGLRCPGNSRGVSRAIFDKWVGESSVHMIPTAILPVFCAAARSWLPLQVLAASAGLKLISPDETKLLLWGQAEAGKRKISKRAKKLAEEIGL
jgi:hypothetical protein